MRHEIEKVKCDLTAGSFVFDEIIHLLRIIDHAGDHRQYHNGEEEGREELLQYKKVEYFKVSLEQRQVR